MSLGSKAPFGVGRRSVRVHGQEIHVALGFAGSLTMPRCRQELIVSRMGLRPTSHLPNQVPPARIGIPIFGFNSSSH